MHPDLIDLGFLHLKTYGACMAVGFILCWTLIERLSGKINMSAYAILSSPVMANGVLRGDLLMIHLKSPFAKKMVDTTENAGTIGRVFSELLGRSVRVVFSDEPPKAEEAPDRSKLEELRRFPIVKFDS